METVILERGNPILSRNQMTTLWCEYESMVNSTSLWDISSSTPSKKIRKMKMTNICPQIYEHMDFCDESASNTWRIRTHHTKS